MHTLLHFGDSTLFYRLKQWNIEDFFLGLMQTEQQGLNKRNKHFTEAPSLMYSKHNIGVGCFSVYGLLLLVDELGCFGQWLSRVKLCSKSKQR